MNRVRWNYAKRIERASVANVSDAFARSIAAHVRCSRTSERRNASRPTRLLTGWVTSFSGALSQNNHPSESTRNLLQLITNGDEIGSTGEVKQVLQAEAHDLVKTRKTLSANQSTAPRLALAA